MNALPVMTLLAAPTVASVSGADRGRAGEATGTRFGTALALAALELPVVELDPSENSAGAPAGEDDSTDPATPVTLPVDGFGGGASECIGPRHPAPATALIAEAPRPGVAAPSGPSAPDVAPPADSGEAPAATMPAAAALSTPAAAPADPGSAAGEQALSGPDASPVRATAPAPAPATAGVRTAPVAPEAFQPTAPERPANPPQVPTAPPTLAPRESEQAEEAGPAHRVTHAAPAVAPAPTSVSAPAPVEASGPPAATPRAIAAQVSPTVIAIAQRPSGTHQLTMTVHPESLGPVTVRARIGAGGDVQVELLGATDAGRDALRAIVADLRRDLAAVMPNASLSLASSSAGETGAHDRDAQPGIGERAGDQPEGAQRPDGESTPRAVSTAADRSVPTTVHAASGAGLDIFV